MTVENTYILLISMNNIGCLFFDSIIYDKVILEE